jgi:hypothetical protein
MYNLVAQASVVLFIVVVIFVCMWRFLRRLSTPLSLIVVSLDLQAKLKVVVELNHSFQEVYGVKIDDRMKRWFAFVKFFSLDFLPTLSIPRDCLRSKKNGYIYNVYWQYILSCILIIIVSIGKLSIERNKHQSSTGLAIYMWDDVFECRHCRLLLCIADSIQKYIQRQRV